MRPPGRCSTGFSVIHHWNIGQRADAETDGMVRSPTASRLSSMKMGYNTFAEMLGVIAQCVLAALAKSMYKLCIAKLNPAPIDVVVVDQLLDVGFFAGRQEFGPAGCCGPCNQCVVVGGSIPNPLVVIPYQDIGRLELLNEPDAGLDVWLKLDGLIFGAGGPAAESTEVEHITEMKSPIRLKQPAEFQNGLGGSRVHE